MQEYKDTLDVPTVANTINKAATRFLSSEQTQADIVAIRQTDPLPTTKPDNPFTAINVLLASGTYHLFVKLDRVFVKVRAVHINEKNPEYLTILISEVQENIWITVPWYLEFMTFFGKRKLIY